MKKTSKAARNQRYSRLRVFAAVMTGAFAGVTTMFVLWTATSMEVLHMCAWSAFAFVGGVILVALITDEDDEGGRRKRKPGRKPPKYITLKDDSRMYCRPVEGAPGYVEVTGRA